MPMMLTLFESRPHRGRLGQGALVSFSVHAILIAAAVAATRPPAPGAEELVNERVQFLLPMDQILGRKSQEPRVQQLQYEIEGQGGGNAGALVRKIERREVATDDAAGKGETEGAIPEPSPPEPVMGDSVYTILEVDSAVVRHPESAAPAYPAAMLAKNIEGSVAAQFIVDTLGLVDPESFVVLEPTQAEFVQAVREALPNMRFRPAIAQSMKVRQLVQQAFTFKIQRPPEPVPGPSTETAKGQKKPD